MRIVLDGTPLLGARTGIGRYTEHLVEALLRRGDLDLAATAFTLRGAGKLAAALPAGVAARHRPAPARALRALWSRFELPPVQWLCGNADVFHATNFVLPPPGRAAGVVTIHDLAYLTDPDVVDATSRRLRDLVPRSLSRASVVCTPSRATADLVLDAYGPLVRDVVVTSLGVDAHWLTAEPPGPADRHRLRLPERYFLFVGTREPRKDLATLLDAYANFRGEAGSATAPELLLVGPSGWQEEVAPAAGVQVRPYLPSEDLRLVVAAASAVVMPSRDEGFGLPALEALAAGVAVIVSRIPALIEVTGGLAADFPVGDVDALAQQLWLTAQSSPAGGAESAARRRYAAEWTWDRCAERTVLAYRRAATG